MEIWYTRPDKSFCSFYYYDRDEHELVRIRLELKRTSNEIDDGSTFAVYRRNRYVGFSKKRYTKDAVEKFTVDDNGTVLDDKRYPLLTHPKQDHFVYDFSIADKSAPMAKQLHVGNPVIGARWVSLPEGIKEDHLERLAEYCMRKKIKITLTTAAETEIDLANAIRAVIGVEPVSPVETVGPAAKSRRCTII